MTSWRSSVVFGLLVVLCGARDAGAQDSTTGALEIRTTNAAGAAQPGVTVVASAPVLQGTQACITDDRGGCSIGGLPPGRYQVSFYYADLKIDRIGVIVQLGQRIRVGQRIDPASATGEVIEVRDKGAMVDSSSTNQGTRISQDQLKNIPIPGRTFGSALGSAAGSAGDSRGVGFSGSTSLENQYVVDGVNTSSLSYGTIGTPLINEFIEEIQVLTGGYQAEYGRATGAIVNVVTKSGTNQLRGSVFATIVPIQVERTPVRQVASSIDGSTDLLFSGDFGFDLGGPLVKDRLWFYLGFAPQLRYDTVTRTIQRQTDCRRKLPDGTLSVCDPAQYMDGSIDEDPYTGDPIYESLDRRRYRTTSQTYQFVGKLNVAATPEHQGQLSIAGTPVAGAGSYGVAGADSAQRIDYYGFTSDVAAKWTSKFFNNKTEVEAKVGWHRDKYDQDALDDSALDRSTTQVYLSSLSRFAEAGGESARASSGCRDSGASGDPYPLIANCPFSRYNLDSPGFTVKNLEDRRSASLELSHRVTAIGEHVAKVGIDVEDNRTADLRHLTGGQFNQLIPDPGYTQVRIYRYVHPGEGDDVCGFDGDTPRACDFLGKQTSHGQTLNWSAFAQDSWQVLPNLTLNAGLRYEEQRLRYAEDQRDTVDPFTMAPLGKNAIALTGLVAPRLGLVYDPTKEGRAKLYGSVGRFYESIPLALNDFSFSGTTLYGAFFQFDQCEGNTPSQDSTGFSPHPADCPSRLDRDDDDPDNDSAQAGDYYRGGTTVVAPGTRAQYMDEVVIGGEWEPIEDLMVGVALKQRSIGRVLEDMSIDGGTTFIIGNPGYFDGDDERRLEDQIAGLPEGSERSALEARLDGFRTMRSFARPRRDYQAIELSAIKRLSRHFFVQGSYSLSRSVGNYPGLLDADTNSALPNFSTQYDLPELLANRTGALPQDRTHYLKLDAFYVFDFDDDGELTTGVRYRAFSGTPIDALGASQVYGFGESYLMPRGGAGRTPTVSGTDLHVSYGRELARGWKLTGFVDVVNFFNQEQVASVDESYTYDNVNPIVGGDQADLVFAKKQSPTGGETAEPVGRNIGYGTPTGRYVPLFVRFGARLEF